MKQHIKPNAISSFIISVLKKEIPTLFIKMEIEPLLLKNLHPLFDLNIAHQIMSSFLHFIEDEPQTIDKANKVLRPKRNGHKVKKRKRSQFCCMMRE